MPILGRDNGPVSIPVMELEQGSPVNVCDDCPFKGNEGMQAVAELALGELMAERADERLTDRDIAQIRIAPADIERIRPAVRDMAEHLTETPVQAVKGPAELALQALKRFPPGGTERLAACVNRKLAKTCIDYTGALLGSAKTKQPKGRSGRDVLHALR